MSTAEEDAKAIKAGEAWLDNKGWNINHYCVHKSDVQSAPLGTTCTSRCPVTSWVLQATFA